MFRAGKVTGPKPVGLGKLELSVDRESLATVIASSSGSAGRPSDGEGWALLASTSHLALLPAIVLLCEQ
jgi:hypothetical protein